MLTIKYKTAQTYNIDFKQSKNHAQTIEKLLFTLGDILLSYTEKYQYLVHILNKKNNLEDHLIETVSKEKQHIK